MADRLGSIEIEDGFVREQIMAMRKEVTIAEVNSKFASGAKLGRTDITEGLDGIDLGNFRTYRIEKGMLGGWSAHKSELPFFFSREGEKVSGIFSRAIDMADKGRQDGQECLSTLFVEVGQIQDNPNRFMVIKGVQPCRTNMNDTRCAWNWTPVNFKIEITEEGWNQFSKLLIQDRASAPERCWRFLDILYPRLIGEYGKNEAAGIVMKKTEKLVFIDETFVVPPASQWNLDAPLYKQANSKRVFPAPR